jgi:hypothetical protein
VTVVPGPLRQRTRGRPAAPFAKKSLRALCGLPDEGGAMYIGIGTAVLVILIIILLIILL